MANRKDIVILVVDDQNVCLNPVINTLQEAGFTLANFENEAQKVATISKASLLIEAKTPDVVILDIRLEDGLSIKVVREVQSRKWQPQWIVHSNDWRDPHIRSQYEALGVTKGVVKSDFEAMITIIDEVMIEPHFKPSKPMRFHDLSYAERLEIFYDYIMNLCAIDIDLQRITEETNHVELKEVQQRFFGIIENLRDFILKKED